ncbi:MAG: sulfotransferase family protein [Microcoleaceae cyanobacterium]
MGADDQLVPEPIFLVGAERSGTTVLRLMLKHHSKIAWCNEFEYAVDQVSHPGKWPDLNQYYDWLETHRVFRATGFSLDHTLTYPELVNSFLYQKRESENKPIIGATVHRHFDRVLQIWPDARFIHLIRDPRDVARSCIGMGWAGNVWTGVERWLEAETLWEELQQHLPEQRYVEITYEGLIAEPSQVLTQLCEFIGVAYEPEMLDYTQTSNYTVPDPKYIGQWRRKLSEHEIQLVESRASHLLESRGYELSGLPALEVTSSLEKRLRLQDWWGKVQGRVERLGWPLVIEDFLTRKFGSKERQKQVTLRINAVFQSRLK